MFLHGNLMHLLMNMAVLYQFGEGIKKFFGTKWYLGLYFIGGIATSVMSFYFAYWFYMSNGIYQNMVGASGALCVLLGFYSFFDKRARNGIMTMIVLISFAPLLIGISVAWYAHIIGFAIGFIAAVLGRRYIRIG
jgi:membrane associated rhomboid family serine protease